MDASLRSFSNVNIAQLGISGHTIDHMLISKDPSDLLMAATNDRVVRRFDLKVLGCLQPWHRVSTFFADSESRHC